MEKQRSSFQKFDFKKLYLFLAIFGFIIPFSEFIPFLFRYHFDLGLMFNWMFENHISSFFTWDVIFSALAVLTFIIADIQSRHVKYRWWAFVLTLLIGPSCGLPLYLYLRKAYSYVKERN